MNNGTSWSAVNNGLTNTAVWSLAVVGTNLFVGKGRDGVFLSTNNGTNWVAASTGFMSTGIYTFAANSDGTGGKNLFVGTDGSGVWRRPLSEMLTSAEKLSTDLPTHFCLDQNYPNPFNPTTAISYQLTAISFVTLKVFDLVGRDVATLVSEELTPGNYTCQWNAAGLPSGVYFYRLEAGSYVETKKLVLLR